jgi:hypothetical protein
VGGLRMKSFEAIIESWIVGQKEQWLEEAKAFGIYEFLMRTNIYDTTGELSKRMITYLYLIEGDK